MVTSLDDLHHGKEPVSMVAPSSTSVNVTVWLGTFEDRRSVSDRLDLEAEHRIFTPAIDPSIQHFTIGSFVNLPVVVNGTRNEN